MCAVRSHSQPSARNWLYEDRRQPGARGQREARMSLHKEIHFESEICQHLASQGWLYAEGDAALFDRTHGLFMPDLLAWAEATQPESFQRLTKTHGPALPTILAERVRKNL